MSQNRYLTHTDAEILTRLAECLLRLGDIQINAGAKILDVVCRSTILPPMVRKAEFVSLNCEVNYCHINPDYERSIVLVSPEDANHRRALISVTTPLGLALIGRRLHSVVEVQAPEQHPNHLKIIRLGGTAIGNIQCERWRLHDLPHFESGLDKTET